MHDCTMIWVGWFIIREGKLFKNAKNRVVIDQIS